ncbi:hypothetical protein SAMN04489798_2311 [Pseudomonas arsenicoxydans]|uniref:Uncharacterized protein n=1 Tax=Pseudomonas arsenicoxydans TaxID=702115 RepID=A0A1H0HM65_9PSED|nr:hypothetical protein [Pseudomonas arsenicoxydans]SDO20298.1 hypothetical protein SAMN04489798_2311 [Pseudomonas arsenicoxydans]
MKDSTKKKIRHFVVIVVGCIAAYIVFNVKGGGIEESLAGAALGVVLVALSFWWSWPTDDEMEEKNPGYKQRKKDELVSRWEEPKPEPLSPELTELAEKIRKKLK